MEELRELQGAFVKLIGALIVIAVAICLVGIQGCAKPSTTGSYKEIRVDFTINLSGENNRLTIGGLDGITGGDMETGDMEAMQEANANPVTDFSIPVDIPGLDVLGKGLQNITGKLDIGTSEIPVKIDTSGALPVLVPDKTQVPVLKPSGEKKPVTQPPSTGAVRQNYTKMRKMGTLSWNGESRIHAAYYFPKRAGAYNCPGAMKFTWSDGNSMVIPDPTHDTIINSRDGRRFNPGPDGDGENDGMMVYAKLGTKPAYVDMSCL